MPNGVAPVDEYDKIGAPQGTGPNTGSGTIGPFASLAELNLVAHAPLNPYRAAYVTGVGFFDSDGSSWSPRGGGAASLAAQVPVGTRNGVNTSFTTSGTAKIVIRNGQVQSQLADGPTAADVSISGPTITFAVAPLATDNLLAFV